MVRFLSNPIVDFTIAVLADADGGEVVGTGAVGTAGFIIRLYTVGLVG